MQHAHLSQQGFSGLSVPIRDATTWIVSDKAVVPIAASLYDETLKVWKVASGRDLGTLVSHTGYVTGVAVSGEGRIAVSASSDQILKVWEVETAIASLLSTCDSAAQRCAYTRGFQTDSRWRCSGHVHFLRFEQPNPRPLCAW
jgi:WD40 repeat protein